MSQRNPRPLLQRADELIGRREFDRALSILLEFERKTDTPPDINIEVRFLTGSALYERGDFDQAIPYLISVADEPTDHPDRPEALLLLGYIYIFKAFDCDDIADETGFSENIQLALPYFQRIETDYPDMPDIGEVYSRLGQCYLEINDLHKAIEYYLMAKKSTNNEALIAFYLRKLGSIYQDLEEYANAAELLRESLKHPDTPNGRANALSNLGRIMLFVDDDPKEAAALFSQALELFDPKAEDYSEASHDHALYAMGEILLESEDNEAARYFFEKVIRMNNSHTGNVELATEALFDIATVKH